MSGSGVVCGSCSTRTIEGWGSRLGAPSCICTKYVVATFIRCCKNDCKHLSHASDEMDHFVFGEDLKPDVVKNGE